MGSYYLKEGSSSPSLLIKHKTKNRDRRLQLTATISGLEMLLSRSIKEKFLCAYPFKYSNLTRTWLMPTGWEHSNNSDNPLILKELGKDSKTTDSSNSGTKCRSLTK